MVRKSTGSSSMFQEGKENHKDVNVIRSPAAKGGSKNFMAPTISAASKFTPSPRKKILGEKNDVTRTSLQFFDKESDLKAESVTFDNAVEQKETVLEVTFNSSNDSTEQSDVTENFDFVKIRPFCCSPITSPIIAPLDSDPHLPPYDPKKNFLSPRPQYLRYKPNPRIELFLNKEGNDDYYREEGVTRLEESFNLSDDSSDTEVEVEVEQENETEAELGDSVHGSSEISSEIVSEEKKSDSEVKITSKARFFTRSKTVSFIFLMFLVACFSVSFTDLPPMDLPIYQDVSFSEIYHESLKFAGFAKESFDDLVENVKNWSADFVSYLSHQKSQLFSTQKISSIQFFNLTTSPIQEEFVFNRHIGTDYLHDLNEETQEFDEEMQEFDEEIEVDDDIDVEDEVVIDDIDVEDEVMIEEINEVQPDEQIKSDDGFVETKVNLEDGPVIESQPETVMNDLEIESIDESETLSSLLTKSVNTICLASFLMVIMAASSIFYLKKRKSNATKTAKIQVADGDDDTCRESCSAESSSVEKGYKKKSINNKRESLASSSSDFSMSCSPSYGSFTTFERIPIKHVSIYIKQLNL